MNSVNAVVPTQMITPIKSLPLKTSSQQEADIDDPLIQGVLKEFEDDFIDNSQQQQAQHAQEMQARQDIQQQQQLQQQQQQQVLTAYQATEQPMMQQQHHQNLRYNKGDSKKLLDMGIAKKAALITFMIFALQYTKVFGIITNRLPASVSSYINDKETLLSYATIFIIVYVVIYFEVL